MAEARPVAERPRVVVIGAGIAGLAAAHALRGRADVTLLDASERVGGKLRTSPIAGIDVEEGAESFLVRVPDAQRLARRVGLGHEIVHPATTSAGILVGDRMHPIPARTLLGVPTDPVALIRSRVLSPRGLVRLAADLVLPRTPLPADPTVGAYVGARVGRQVVDRLVDPLLGGVYAGRADALSLHATVPQLIPIATEDRSLLLGAWRVRARTGPAAPAATAPVFGSLRGGLGSFAQQVARVSGARIVLGARVTSLRRVGAGWRVTVDGGEVLDADAVVLAVPGPVAAGLLAPHTTQASRLLAGVPYASIALVTLVYSHVTPPPGSGFLVPPSGSTVIKAATYLTSKWPHVGAGSGLTVIRASVGRAGDAGDLARPDVELAGVVAAEVAGIAGITARPVATRVSRWDGGLPQYLPGHRDLVARLRRALPDGVAVAGAAYDGVGIPACIRSGEAAAEQVLSARVTI